MKIIKKNKDGIFDLYFSKYSILIFLFSIGFSLVTNIMNINVTHLMYGVNDNILYGSTLVSPDNIWYLSQIKNYVNGLGFTIDPLDPIYSVRRTPGYPLFYGLHYIIFDEAGAHKIIPFTQTMLHGVAAVYLYKLGKLLFTNPLVGFWAGILYGLSPFIASFLFMTITESIFPALIVFSIYLSVSCYVEKSSLRATFAGLMMSIVVLVRPSAGLTLLFFVVLALYFRSMTKEQKIKINLFFYMAFIIGMSPWTVRNYLIFDKFLPFETYYLNGSYENQNIKNIALYRWWSTWGSPDGLRLHEAIGRDINSNQPFKSIDNFINDEVPIWVFNVQNKSELRRLLIDYQKCMVRSNELNGGRRLRYLEIPDSCEYQVSAVFDEFSNKIRSQFPFQAFIVSPLYKRGKEYIFHSTIHTWRSFDDYKSNSIKTVLKSVAYTVNVLLWIFSIAYMLSPRSIYEKMLLGAVPLFSFIFIVYYMHVEGRYLIGIYPFLYLMSSLFLIDHVKPFFKSFLIYFRLTK